MNVSQNSRPYLSVFGECLNCGFSFTTEEDLLSLEQVNLMRADQELEPLKELVKSNGYYEQI